MFYPFHDESKLNVGEPLSYSSNLSEPGVLEIVNNNKSLVEPYSDLVNAAFLNYRAEITPSWDPFSQQENEDVENELCDIELNDQTEISYPDKENQTKENYSETVSSELHTTILSDSVINNKIRSLNLKQRQIFDFIYNWAKSHVKVKRRTTSKQSAPFHLFLSGSGGCGKSNIIKTVFHAVNKVLLYRSGDPVKPRVLLLAPTDVAKININGNTVHSGLHIPCQGKLFPLNDANKAELINKYAEVELVIIDKISMVSSKLFYQIQQKRLREIFSSRQDIPSGGKSILVCGNLRELPPVCAKPVFTFNNTKTTEGYINMDLCLKIRLAELDQLMHQDDEVFVNMLNKIRVGEIDWNLEDVFKLHFIDKKDRCYPGNILHIFAENAQVKRHIDNQLRHIPGQLIIIPAKDEVPKNFKISDIREEQNRKQSETRGLASLLELKVNGRAMLTTNINIEDRLINRHCGHCETYRNERK